MTAKRKRSDPEVSDDLSSASSLTMSSRVIKTRRCSPGPAPPRAHLLSPDSKCADDVFSPPKLMAYKPASRLSNELSVGRPKLVSGRPEFPGRPKGLVSGLPKALVSGLPKLLVSRRPLVAVAGPTKLESKVERIATASLLPSRPKPKASRKKRAAILQSPETKQVESQLKRSGAGDVSDGPKDSKVVATLLTSSTVICPGRPKEEAHVEEHKQAHVEEHKEAHLEEHKQAHLEEHKEAHVEEHKEARVDEHTDEGNEAKGGSAFLNLIEVSLSERSRLLREADCLESCRALHQRSLFGCVQSQVALGRLFYESAFLAASPSSSPSSALSSSSPSSILSSSSPSSVLSSSSHSTSSSTQKNRLGMALRLFAQAARQGSAEAAFLLAEHMRLRVDSSLMWPRSTPGARVAEAGGAGSGEDIYSLHPAAELFRLAAVSSHPGAATRLASLLLSWAFRELKIQPLGVCTNRILSLASADATLLSMIVSAPLACPLAASAPLPEMAAPRKRLPSVFLHACSSQAALTPPVLHVTPSVTRRLPVPPSTLGGGPPLLSLSACLDQCAASSVSVPSGVDVADSTSDPKEDLAANTASTARAPVFLAEAVRWLETAIVQDKDAEASCRLAEFLLVDAKILMFHGGRSTAAQSVKRAFDLWVAAARQNHLLSLHYVALCLLHGMSGSLDLVVPSSLLPSSDFSLKRSPNSREDGLLLLKCCAVVHKHPPSLRELGWWHLLQSSFDVALDCLQSAAASHDESALFFLQHVKRNLTLS